MKNKFFFGDLFAGAGLFSEGLRQAGLKPTFAIELSRDAAATYALNVGQHVRTASVLDVVDVPEIDVLVAGPPCQGFSTLGRRDPADTRSDLSLAVIPWVRKTKAKVVVIENVPPFLKSNQGRLLRFRLSKL